MKLHFLSIRRQKVHFNILGNPENLCSPVEHLSSPLCLCHTLTSMPKRQSGVCVCQDLRAHHQRCAPCMCMPPLPASLRSSCVCVCFGPAQRLPRLVLQQRRSCHARNGLGPHSCFSAQQCHSTKAGWRSSRAGHILAPCSCFPEQRG